ncbi:MAG: plastocyanin/azurin family copper-binding protein [Gemmatimonadota bacterium]|nr:plastocyanin/azurin family copper-binding protein [Gemmatimonadota bacterium]
MRTDKAFLVMMIASLAGGVVSHSASQAPATRARTVHRVELVGNRFLPRHLEIAVGDAVEFVNGAGGPHNAAFWQDSLPAGARDPLSRALPDSIGPLIGPLLFESDQTWTVIFDGVPPGRYPYYCLPHVVGAMVGEIEVRGEKKP